MEFGWAPEDVAFRAELRAFLEEELPDHWHGRTAILGSAENAEYSHRFAQGTAIYGGTTDVHRNIIAERMLGLPRSTPR